jgi:hypothetical protein
VEVSKFNSWKHRRVYIRKAGKLLAREALDRQMLPEGTKGGPETILC